MINRLHGEIEGHEFNDWAKSAKSGTNAKARKTMLGNRRIDDAARAEILQQFTGDFVSALVFSNFLAHDEDGFVPAHLFGHGIAQSITQNCFCIRCALRNIRIGQQLSRRRLCISLRFEHFWFCDWRDFFDIRFRRRCDAGSIFAIFSEDSDDGIHFDAFRAFRDENFGQRALIDRFDFHRRFICFDLSDHVACLDFVAFAFQPFGQRAFFHGRAQGGHQNINSHVYASTGSRTSVHNSAGSGSGLSSEKSAASLTMARISLSRAFKSASVAMPCSII
mmetsp:Transcript_9046/g.11787  ORF Transcript_9046/g.11787 Transcript_9046/m.11787 type:complete len:278 (+) Transcript_9046:645-1478(+)